MTGPDWTIPLLVMGEDLTAPEWARVLDVPEDEVRAAARGLCIELAAESTHEARARWYRARLDLALEALAGVLAERMEERR